MELCLEHKSRVKGMVEFVRNSGYDRDHAGFLMLTTWIRCAGVDRSKPIPIDYSEIATELEASEDEVHKWFAGLVPGYLRLFTVKDTGTGKSRSYASITNEMTEFFYPEI